MGFISDIDVWLLIQSEQGDQIKTAATEHEACSLTMSFVDSWGGFENCPLVVEAFKERMNFTNEDS